VKVEDRKPYSSAPSSYRMLGVVCGYDREWLRFMRRWCTDVITLKLDIPNLRGIEERYRDVETGTSAIMAQRYL